MEQSVTTLPGNARRNGKPAPAETAATEVARGTGIERGIGLRSAVAINMTQMCGIGPFVTIPLMIATLGGPQAVFGGPQAVFVWIVGALLALADGLVWAELAAKRAETGRRRLSRQPAPSARRGR